MRRIIAAVALAAAVVFPAPAAAQFGGSPGEQVEGDGAPVLDPDGVAGGKWDGDGYREEWEGKPERGGDGGHAEAWPDGYADGNAAPDAYGGKDDPAAGYAESGDIETRDGGDGYCRRSDGTTGLVLGAGTGALVGRGFDTRGERGTGTILGAIAGALLGSAVERGASCR